MASQDQVIELNRLHPEWTARQIAEELGVSSAYISAVKHRHKLTLGSAASGRKHIWTPEAVKTAKRLMKERAGDDTFRRVLGFSKKAADGKLRRENTPPSKHSAPGERATVIPAHVIEDRERRYAALSQRTLTAILMGDPA